MVSMMSKSNMGSFLSVSWAAAETVKEALVLVLRFSKDIFIGFGYEYEYDESEVRFRGNHMVVGCGTFIVRAIIMKWIIWVWVCSLLSIILYMKSKPPALFVGWLLFNNYFFPQINTSWFFLFFKKNTHWCLVLGFPCNITGKKPQKRYYIIIIIH